MTWLDYGRILLWLSSGIGAARIAAVKKRRWYLWLPIGLILVPFATVGIAQLPSIRKPGEVDA
ncbi:hypothetical protein QO002_002398 [Pararhizobium capsulatum DSM 1112]|uniref:Uncharacterized protein n=1 Tax=Pararhizobium capsulatum DSM 1112 TaxID=1121113 RepID=A0ABU0BPU3_9HYPH|nr:hypothetical protein [Pararhizobium capsulatum DSM 1112]